MGRQGRIMLGQALAKAHKASIKDGRLRFVFATAYGFKSGTSRPAQTCLWTNGVDAGRWEWPKPEGESDLELSLKLHQRFGTRGIAYKPKSKDENL